MSEKKPDEPARKRRRWRLRLDGLQVNWPLAGGLTVAGTGVAAVVVLVVYLVLHRGSPIQGSPHVGQRPTATPTTTTSIPHDGGSVPDPGPAPGHDAEADPGTKQQGSDAPRRIPELTGLDLAAARTKLGDADLTVGSVSELESDQPANTVLRTNPPAGATVGVSAAVDLVVAKAPLVLLGVGRVDPDPAYPDCATGYQVVFSQQISVTQPTRVTYQWLRSDDAGSELQYLDFTEPGTRTVTTQWRRWGQPGETLDGWEQVKILTPQSITGQPVNFSHTCPYGPG